jgi:hypothetical protein
MMITINNSPSNNQHCILCIPVWFQIVDYGLTDEKAKINPEQETMEAEGHGAFRLLPD